MCLHPNFGAALVADLIPQQRSCLPKQRIGLSDEKNYSVEAACAEGFDGMSKLVTRVLGEEAWHRMVSNAPAAWDDPTCACACACHVHVHVPITLSLTR